MSREDSLKKRRQVTGGNLSLGYTDPLKIVRGEMQYLFDETGRRYLDAYNNVPHVGHCHPEVVEAASEQMRTLNTNTRYLSDHFNDYAEALLATMPAELDTCFFLNSASEANELALRLSRAATGFRDTIVAESAYHGHTTTLIDISPYKHDGPGGSGAPDWVHAVPNPETYPSVGGQIITPDGYLSEVYQHVRKAGGLCIADEVQTCYGRIGNAFYAFEQQGVVPDVVVLGKPIGNGHPLAALVTRRDIADAFDNGMEFFSTFGGSTLSCVIGKKVLELTQREGLQQHARATGEGMLKKFEGLKQKYPLIGDVRGAGLFLGVELVKDHDSLEPAASEASEISNALKEVGILIGIDGSHHNGLKIRPPMPFDDGNAEELVAALDHTLARIQ